MFKWITRISVVLILCLSSVAVFAQDATPAVPDISMFCGDLAKADCDLLHNASEAMKSLSSATFNFGVKLAFSDAKITEPQTLSIEGKGSFAGLPTNAMGMGMMSSAGNPAALFKAMSGAIKDFKGDIALTINLPPALLESVAHGDKSVKLPDAINLELRMVDGVGYINTDTLKPLLEGMGQKMPSTLKGWVGIDVIQFMTKMIASNPQIFSQMGTGMMMNADGGVNPLMSDPTAFASAVKIERGADKDGAATFTVTLDFAKLAADPAFAEMIRAQAEKQGHKITDEELQTGLDAIAQAGDAIQFSATESIDLETNFIRNVSLNIALDGSKLPKGTSTGGQSSDSMANTTISLTATVSLADFNNAPEITAPEKATILPPAFLEQMTKGMMGGSGSSPANPAEATPEATPAS